MTNENKITCVICHKNSGFGFQYDKWEDVGNPIRYCCKEHWEALYNDTGKAWADYMKRRERHKVRTFGKPVWMTICPTRDVQIEKFHKIINKLCRGALVCDKSWWTYEWRHNLKGWTDFYGEGDLPDNDGLHAHGWMRLTSLNSFKTKVKRMCKRNGWIYNDMMLISCDYPEKDKINYVSGLTESEDKNIKKSLDRLRRDKYKIKNFFEVGYDIETPMGQLSNVRERGEFPEHYINDMDETEL